MFQFLTPRRARLVQRIPSLEEAWIEREVREFSSERKAKQWFEKNCWKIVSWTILILGAIVALTFVVLYVHGLNHRL